jgi:hypothetical protein
VSTLSCKKDFVIFMSEYICLPVKRNLYKEYIKRKDILLLMAWEVSDMIIHRLHYRNLNSYLACYFHHLKRVPLHHAKIMHVTKIKKEELSKSKVKLLGAMA